MEWTCGLGGGTKAAMRIPLGMELLGWEKEMYKYAQY
jgi:hypothetical protein